MRDYYNPPVNCGRCLSGDVDCVDGTLDRAGPTWACGDCDALYASLYDAVQGAEWEWTAQPQPRPDRAKRRIEKCFACKQLTFQVKRSDGKYSCKNCLYVGRTS